MKKISVLLFIFFFAMITTGCDKQDMSYVSKPIGYALLDDTYVAKSSLTYQIDNPYNVNQLTLELYYLPSIWGEIEAIEGQTISESDPNVIIINNNTENQKIYAKYIFIAEDTWTGENDNGQIKYVNQNGDTFLERYADEEQAKAYVEALEMNNAYFLNFEMGMLNGYSSKLQLTSSELIFQKMPDNDMIFVNYSEDLTEFPDLSSYFPDFDGEEINALFQRAFEKANQEEFRTSVFIGKS